MDFLEEESSTGKDFEGGTRNLDFTTLLNEKENQIVELEKKSKTSKKDFEEQALEKSSLRTELLNSMLKFFLLKTRLLLEKSLTLQFNSKLIMKD